MASSASWRRLVVCAATAGLAGFLMGFDTIVISGAEQTIQQLWGLSGTVHGMCMSAALFGTVLGALAGGYPAERWGRRRTLLAIGVLYFVSSLGTALAGSALPFAFFRFVGGLGVGVATIASPLYVSEISPAGMRGRLTGLFQLNIVFGILIALLSNAAIGALVAEDVAWRWMLAVMAFPSVLYTLLCLGIPESPRWLISTAQKQQGLAVFREVNPTMDEAQIAALGEGVVAALAAEAPAAGEAAPKFWRRELRRPHQLAFCVAFFNQLSGINAVLVSAATVCHRRGGRLTQTVAAISTSPRAYSSWRASGTRRRSSPRSVSGWSTRSARCSGCG